MTPYRDRIGHRRLVRLACDWWEAVVDPKVSEVERGRRYRLLTEQLRLVTGKDRRP